MLTRRGVLLLVAGLLLWLVGRLLGVDELYVGAIASVAVVAVGAATVAWSTATVSVRRSLSASRLLSGATAEVRLDLRNDARVPAGLLLVSDDCPYPLVDSAAFAPGSDGVSRPRFVVPGLGQGRQVTVTYPVTGSTRGRHELGPVSVRVRDPFGAAQRVRRYRATDQVVVYPTIEPLAEGPARGSHRGSGASDSRRLFNTGEEFYTLREYVTGDDLRQVHWASTARRQRLMVRQLELPWQAEATVLCDTRTAAHRGVGPTSSLERAISVAASLVWHLADRDYQLRLVTEATAGPPAVERWDVLLDRLAELEASRVELLAPAVRRLRGSGAEGLLFAVVAAPPGTDQVTRHPDVRALLEAGRSFTARAAFVLDTGGRDEGRAARTAEVLATAGWRATSLAVGEPLHAAWKRLFSERRRTMVAATRGGGSDG